MRLNSARRICQVGRVNPSQDAYFTIPFHSRSFQSRAVGVRKTEMWSLAFRVYLLICSDASEDSEFIYSYAQRPLKILSLFACMLKRPLKILSLFTHTLIGLSRFWVYLLVHSKASQDSEFIYSYAQRPLKILSLFTHTPQGLSRFWVYLLVHSEASQDSEVIHPYTQGSLEILSAFTRTLLRFWVYLLALSKASQLKTVKREPHRGGLRHQRYYRQEWNKEYAQKWRRLFNLITVSKVSLSLTQDAWACCSGLRHFGKLPQRLQYWA